MPEWLQPSGLFGIGLQSVFQIADCIEFYTRQHNMPERRIALYSYGRNRGRIEVNEVIPEEDLVYYTNSIPGTNAKIIINPDKIYIDETEDAFFDFHKEKPKLVYFDNDFHNKSRLDIIFNEMCEACKAVIRSSPSDYFRIGYQEIIQTSNKENGKEDNDKNDIKTLRDSYFINPEDLSKSDTGSKASSSSNKGSRSARAKRQFSVKGIEKSVLKPDSKYPHLIVDRYPVTFQLNDSISHYLNECIKSYIISPFDANSLTLLNECIMKYPDEELGKSLMDHILTSEMYSNCEKYILKHSIYGEINLAETPSWKAFIKKEYTEFITDFCRILHENMNEVKSLLAKEINN